MVWCRSQSTCGVVEVVITLLFPTLLKIALAPSQEREPGRAFTDARWHVDGHIKIVHFLPQMFSLLRRTNFILEYRETSNGVGEIERTSAFMAAIDRKRFDVARFG
jgi:hypothetical protein